MILWLSGSGHPTSQIREDIQLLLSLFDQKYQPEWESFVSWCEVQFRINHSFERALIKESKKSGWKGSQSNSDDVDKKTLPKKFKPANQKLTCRPPRPDLAFRLKSRPPWPPEQKQ